MTVDELFKTILEDFGDIPLSKIEIMVETDYNTPKDVDSIYVDDVQCIHKYNRPIVLLTV